MLKSSHSCQPHCHNLMPLNWCKAGSTVEIVSIRGGRKMQNRINDLGILPGTQVKVIQNHSSGPILLEYRGSKLVIGNGIVRHLLVR